MNELAGALAQGAMFSQDVTTQAVGEEAGTITTLALGEEAGTTPPPITPPSIPPISPPALPTLPSLPPWFR